MGIGSLPAQLGASSAALLACVVMAVPQVVVVALADRTGAARSMPASPWRSCSPFRSALMVRLLREPARARALVQRHRHDALRLGMLVSAFALRPSSGRAP